MNYTIQLEHKSKIVHYIHTGILKKEDIGYAWNEFLEIPEFTSKGYNLLSDYRNAKFDLQVKDVDLICDFLSKLEQILRAKKQAIVIEDPISTALTMLFKNEVYERVGFEISVFCTVEAARTWLKK